MSTPLRSVSIQGTKRSRTAGVPLSANTIGDHDLAEAAELVNSDASIPLHLKALLGHLLDSMLKKDEELETLRRRDGELMAENARLKEEIASLKASLASSSCRSTQFNSSSQSSSPLQVGASDALDEYYRVRSVVISGICECSHPSPMFRVSFDLDCCKKLFHFLGIECMPLTCYRMGRPRRDVPRLLKVVLPTRFFQQLILRRAPRLRHFPVKGVFIRPSLTKQEREERAARNLRTLSRNTSSVEMPSPSAVHATTLLSQDPAVADSGN